MVFWFQPNVNLPVTLVHYRGEQIRLDATQLNSNFLVLEMLLNHLFALDRSNQKFKIKDCVGDRSYLPVNQHPLYASRLAGLRPAKSASFNKSRETQNATFGKNWNFRYVLILVWRKDYLDLGHCIQIESFLASKWNFSSIFHTLSNGYANLAICQRTAVQPKSK